MPSEHGTLVTEVNGKPQTVSYFHDSASCVEGKEHDWSGWREDDETRTGERVCVNCGMGAMHHSLMTCE